ncbi:MAG TPA: 3-methyl-2-oxobutanoate dehydrogenase subunit VorB [Spirochaetota bacterium]|nr:3-methyl-2-oxobutanoate dehydrogenase subunit VorB [Spirochaetota bacterium]HPC41454.1 3-methyl-2-oxobutanoate dehydrogenase subunit VorB [Spirochaetota bacterium]HPL18688.1 3-methyl-2-oxobutanoate dehydrogenase subunit VorB [Spirochaetota bacterium]HQF10460.1 3-methyl-2-oxobutanoate dehydrogenase subunit VorB [Spirochaetota bacterium]HQH99419.1 3-methyl-2-oxobutanoate dehydrogenase subunit VorB [Spirochaetota bacterium]
MTDKKLTKGNIALAEGAIQAGCRYYFGYPITPQNDIPEYLARELPKHGGTFIPAESEIASINMVLGAGASGARAMTSSSGPGISLMQEGLSYLAGSDIPGLVVNIMRCGPGLGGISPTQGDYMQAVHGGGHGDYRNIVLAPASVQEMFDLTIKGFELADRYRMMSIILADAMVGQFQEPCRLTPDHPVVMPDKPWALKGRDGKKPKLLKSLYLGPGEQEQHNLELKKKYDEVRANEVLCEEFRLDDADLMIVAFGTPSRISKTAIRMAKEEGLKIGLLRPITLFPFPEQQVYRHSERIKKILVVEMNTGQMLYDVKINAHKDAKLSFYGRPGGGIPFPDEVLAEIKKALE